MAALLAALGLALVAVGWRPVPPAPAAGRTVAVVVTTRAIEPGHRVTREDVDVTRVGDAPAVEALLHDTSQALGRSARVALASGVPLSTAVLSAEAPTEPGQRRVRLRLDQAAVPPGMQPGDRVEIVAAAVDGQTSGGGRIVVVGRAQVVEVGPSGNAGGPEQVGDLVTVDVDTGAVERVLWAEAFAKWVRLLVRPAGDASSLSDPGAGAP